MKEIFSFVIKNYLIMKDIELHHHIPLVTCFCAAHSTVKLRILYVGRNAPLSWLCPTNYVM